MAHPKKASALGYGLTGLLLLLGSSAGSESFAQTAPPVILEYWAEGPPDAQVPGPYWVPLSLLNQPYETWDPKYQSKISKKKLKEFRDVVYAVMNQGTSGRCTPVSDCAFWETGDLVSVKGAAANNPVVVHATILSVEPGWDFAGGGMVATLVRARIETVIKGAGLAVGQEIMYLRPWGILEYDNTILCSIYAGASNSKDAAFDSPGLEVVVIGQMSRFNDFHIETPAGWEFVITHVGFVSTIGGGLVEPPEFTLEDLIQSVKGK